MKLTSILKEIQVIGRNVTPKQIIDTIDRFIEEQHPNFSEIARLVRITMQHNGYENTKDLNIFLENASQKTLNTLFKGMLNLSKKRLNDR